MGPKLLTPEELITPAETPQAEPLEAPVIDKESLMARLQNIPTETLRSILMNQVDLEIRLKHRELRLTEEEMGKCEAQMLALRKFFDVPNDVTFNGEPNDFTLKYYDVLNKSLSVSYTRLQQQLYQEQPKFNEAVFETAPPEPAHYRTRSTTSSLRPSITGPGLRVAGCLYRRTDGIIVKLTCPDCHRSNFSSAQGFLNHSRIAHTKEYTSQDAAALQCGELLPDDFQDDEGVASLKSLRQKELDPSRHLNVNEMYFDGLSSTLGTAAVAPQEPFQKVQRSQSKDENNELMKKLIKSGVAQDAKAYKELVDQARQDVPNAHLFEGEVEESEIEAPATPATPATPRVERPKPEKLTSRRGIIEERRHPESGGKYENRLRRRKSRSFADEDDVPKRRKR